MTNPEYVLRFADTALVSAQRLCEWVGHAPELEEELALANLGLDLLEQARSLLSYAGSLYEPARTEDQMAMQRNVADFRNFSLVEQPNGDFAVTIARQALLSAWQEIVYTELAKSSDTTLAEFADKALPEAVHHWQYTSRWLLRLGDGTPESHERAQRALNDLWRFTGELFAKDAIDNEAEREGVGPALNKLQPYWLSRIATLCNDSTLFLPTVKPSRWYGKQGQHGEDLGYLLADLQALSRTYPNAAW